jgi:hypothetical protein
MNQIKLNCLSGSSSSFKVSQLDFKRDWMEGSNAYRCLPLNIASQYGWAVHSPIDFSASWNGGMGVDSIQVYAPDDQYVTSHFGYGILTVKVDFIVTTDKNVSLYVKGISNSSKSNIYALEGIVETDWLPFTFTMNYKFHTPGTVSFQKDEPLFMFFPIERTFIEKFELVSDSIKNSKELNDGYKKYSKARNEVLQNEHTGSGYQKFYKDGIVVDTKVDIENHKRKLDLKGKNNPA